MANYIQEKLINFICDNFMVKRTELQLDLSLMEQGIIDSLGAIEISSYLEKEFNRKIPVSIIFQYPTIKDLSDMLNIDKSIISYQEKTIKKKSLPQSYSQFNNDVAVVGLSCQFPGATNVEEYWQLLTKGQETISFFNDKEILPDIDKNIRNNELYVRAKGIISDSELFDAGFFGFTRQVAEVTDPQIRLFLENAYKALQNSGYSPNNKDTVGIYAGMGRSLYLRYNLLTRPDIIDQIDELQIELGNEKDHIATRLSHILNLTGPSISVSTACSTSLVAIAMAYESIIQGNCTLALAGGSNIILPVYKGHLHQGGAMYSHDGHCRPFDADATGTTFGDGIGVVVLKKYSKAITDNNTIYAIIKGGAINNDGSQKASYTAPGINGQIAVITSALECAGVSPETISYIETHGTATPLGDPIEIDALTQAFRKHTDKNQFCAIGSVKSNIGHTAIAAGVAGFIKTVLMLYHKTLVPSINFNKPNPAIEFNNTPFFVNTKLTSWITNGAPHRAGVSSFGFGGTNAHVILEEAPIPNHDKTSKPYKMLPFSAKSSLALDNLMKKYIEYLSQHNDILPEDIAYTLQTGRIDFKYRRFIVCRTNQDAINEIKKTCSLHDNENMMLKNAYSLIFLFPGQGTQYIKMGYALYNNEPVFRAEFDKCCNIFYAEMKEDIRNTIFSDSPDAIEKIKDTYFAQPALFALEYSLSCLWKDWGIQPSMLVGHSIGEFVAACISGIMQIEDAAKLVAIRARLMHDLPHGTMMSVRLPEHEILKILPSELSIAAVNSPVLSVVSGSSEAINEFKTYCEIKNVACRFLHTSHAFHSAMVDPIIPTFSKEVHKIRLSSPNIPIISTVTGKLLTTMEAIDPEYWTRHMRSTVRFSDAIRIALDSENDNIFLEVGPRATSTILVNQHIATNPHHYAIPSLGNTDEPDLEYKDLMNAIGQLWQLGVSIDWQSYYKNEKRLKLSIPIYPFEKQKYWIEPGIQNTIAKPTEITSSENNNATVNIEQSINLQDKKTDAGINITDEIKKIITEATGDEAYCSDESATFLQMGLDSLFLTQLSQRLRSKFNVTVSMRQLMRETTTINKLAEFIYNKNNK